VPPESHRRIRRVVERIPRGRVATYGQVAMHAGYPRAPRLAGQAMASLPADSEVPWHRVVNARGAVSSRGEPVAEDLQRIMLEDEGVEIGAGGRIDLDRFGWDPEPRPR
jgi:methylated-DNA-protein-cysteine methyltransferase-like protein